MAGKKSGGSRRRLGIRDIAERAKVSTTAVSYALNGTGRLDIRTRKRILKIAEKAGYRANPNARNLRRNSSGVLAISASLPTAMSGALPNMDYFFQIWHGSVASALERGYMLLLAPFGTEPNMLRNVPIDGGIVIDPVTDDPVAAHLREQDLPVVTIGRDLNRPADEEWWIDSPHAELAGEMFAQFRERGARRIGVILSSPRYAYSVAVRERYIEWIAETGGEAMFIEVDEVPTETAGYEAAMRLLTSTPPPDAIYASLDRLAIGALFAAEKLALRVPDELLLGAGSDGIITRTATVPITALDLQPDKLGRAAVSMLLDRVEHGIEPRQVIVPGRIQFRASTDRDSTAAARQSTSARTRKPQRPTAAGP